MTTALHSRSHSLCCVALVAVAVTGDAALCLCVTGREQKNSFRSGREATFQLAGNNKLKNNIYPTGFVWNVDETTCFNKKTDVPELADVLC